MKRKKITPSNLIASLIEGKWSFLHVTDKVGSTTQNVVTRVHFGSDTVIIINYTQDGEKKEQKVNFTSIAEEGENIFLVGDGPNMVRQQRKKEDGGGFYETPSQIDLYVFVDHEERQARLDRELHLQHEEAKQWEITKRQIEEDERQKKEREGSKRLELVKQFSGKYSGKTVDGVDIVDDEFFLKFTDGTMMKASAEFYDHEISVLEIDGVEITVTSY